MTGSMAEDGGTGQSAVQPGVTAGVTSSGKDAAYENFPVGSWLLPRATRRHVAVFYAFARAIDDIADAPDLAADDKVRLLDRFEAVLLGENADAAADDCITAERMRESLAETGVTARHCQDLLSAFRQDAVQSRYQSWAELIDYCNRSAAPVGRYLIDLHGGTTEAEAGGDAFRPNDALCNALQVLNHLQDCQDDYRTLDRVYLPQDWMAAAGIGVDALDAGRTSPELRRVIDQALDETERLLANAGSLPKRIRSRRLGREAAVILEIAHALVRRLRTNDPLCRRVVLGRLAYVGCFMRGGLGIGRSVPAQDHGG